MNEQDHLRQQVAKAYGRAVKEPSKEGGCCGSAPKGTVAKLAGYGKEELGSLPPDAAVNSFGCGNPVAFSEVGEGEVVLDLGSGAGIDLLLAAKEVGPSGRAIGIDMTDEMVAKARENIAASGLNNVEVRKGLIENLPVESSSVDWVISNCVINLSPEKEKVFAEIARVLKPGGRMIVSDIVLNDQPDWISQIPALYSSCIAGAVSEAAYLEGLREAGLERIEVRDRLVYEEGSLAGLLGSEGKIDACCGGSLSREVAERAVRELAGKVVSVRIHASRRP